MTPAPSPAVEMPAEKAGIVASTRRSLRPSTAHGRQRLAEVALLLLMLSWAVNFIVVKGTGGEIPPMTFGAVRFTTGGLLLLVLLRWREGTIRLPRADILPIAILGMLGFGVYQVLWASAIQLITAGDSALLIAATPVFAVLIAVIARSDHLTAPKLAGALLSFVGVAVVVGRGESGAQFSLVGEFVTLAAAACWAVYTSYIARYLRHHSPLAIAAWAALFGALFQWPFGLAAALSVDWSRVGPLAYGGWLYSAVLSAGLGNIILYDAIRLLGPARATAFQFLVPLFTVVIGALVLAEPVRAAQGVGGAIIVAGVLLTRRGGLARSPEAVSGISSLPAE